jgi:hypothetical protein
VSDQRTDDGDGGSRTRSSDAPPRRLDAQTAARRALEAVQSLTSKQAEGVIGVQRLEEGGWTVVIELLETARIPNTSDVLGEYEVEVDARGRLRSYARRSRYTRGSSSRADD